MTNNNPSLLEAYITEDELAASLKISKRSLANYRARKVIPFLKIGRVIRFNPAAVNAALEQLVVKPKAGVVA